MPQRPAKRRCMDPENNGGCESRGSEFTGSDKADTRSAEAFLGNASRSSNAVACSFPSLLFPVRPAAMECEPDLILLANNADQQANLTFIDLNRDIGTGANASDPLPSPAASAEEDPSTGPSITGNIAGSVNANAPCGVDSASKLPDFSVSTVVSAAVLPGLIADPAYSTIADVPLWLRDRGGIYVTNLPTSLPGLNHVRQFETYCEIPGSILENVFGFKEDHQLTEGEDRTAWLWMVYSLPGEAEHAASDMFAANIEGRQIEIELFMDSLACANKNEEMQKAPRRALL